MEGMKCPVCFMGTIEKINAGHYKCNCKDCEEEYIDRYEVKGICDRMIKEETLKDKAQALFDKLKGDLSENKK